MYLYILCILWRYAHTSFCCDNCNLLHGSLIIFLLKKCQLYVSFQLMIILLAGELSENSWNLTKGGKSLCLGESLSCRQRRRWTKLSCSYLCCELRIPPRSPSHGKPYTQTVQTTSFCGPDEKFALFLTQGSRLCDFLKCFAALIGFDVFSQKRPQQMAEERRANGETCQSGESSKKTKWRPGSGRGGNPWAPQEAAAFLRLGQEKRRPLPLMP